MTVDDFNHIADGRILVTKDELEAYLTRVQVELVEELIGQKLWVDVADDKIRNKTKWRIEAVPVSVLRAKLTVLGGADGADLKGEAHE